ncbi:hypothetical protein MBLNU230_g4802t1 [Neophaeotheca triangularis]
MAEASSAQVLTSKGPTNDKKPRPYTGSPLKLLWDDLVLCLTIWRAVPGILLPILPFRSGRLDELYPTAHNIANVVLHCILIVVQLLFLLSLFILPFVPVVPVGVAVAYLCVFWFSNKYICYLLNFNTTVLESTVDLKHYPTHEDEYWIFLNGVAVGRNWLQSNINLLSLTFGRHITGIHNPTSGIIFDIFQCLLQRCFSYATLDVRNAYARVKTALHNPRYKKVIFVSHSQGGIESALIVDWLLSELSQDVLSKLEVYTFGNAANHFNSPLRRTGTEGQVPSNPASQTPHLAPRNASTRPNPSAPTPASPANPPARVIPHIEHYANSTDFVARWGVLHFACAEDRYVGKIFVRAGSGHLMNQHYLDNMFQLEDSSKPGRGEVGVGNEKRGGLMGELGTGGEGEKGRGGWRVRDGNGFMDLRVKEGFCGESGEEGVDGDGGHGGLSEGVGDLGKLAGHWAGEVGEGEKRDGGLVGGLEGKGDGKGKDKGKVRVKDVSRLWEYRNGGVPRES